MGAEHPAVGVQFVDHHVTQPRKEPCPGLMEGQQPGMQHIRCGDEHVRRRAANLPAPVSRGVAVVDRDAEAAAQALQQGVQLVVLILHQGLEREDIERVRLRVLQQCGDHRHVVDQGLAARRRRRHHDVLAVQRLADALGLMAVKGRHPGGLENVGHRPGKAPQRRRQPARPCRKGGVMNKGVFQHACLEELDVIGHRVGPRHRGGENVGRVPVAHLDSLRRWGRANLDDNEPPAYRLTSAGAIW